MPELNPQNLRAENHTSIDTLPIAWKEIPRGGLPGILLGYRLLYTPVSTGDVEIEEGETKEIFIPPDQTSVVLKNLEIFTKYQVSISGHTTKGDGPFTITFGG